MAKKKTPKASAELKNRDAMRLYKTAQTFISDKTLPLKFSWALMRTAKKIELDLVNSLREMGKPSEGYQKYNAERIELCQKTALKDEAGEFIIQDGQYTFEGGKMPNLAPLMKKYKTEIKQMDEQNKNIDRILDEPYEGDIYKVDLKHLPKEISLEALASLEPMIIDD